MLSWTPALERLDRWVGVLTHPRLASWIVYYGVYTLLAFAGAWLRSALAPWALGYALEPRTFLQFMALLFFALLISAMGIEVFASRRRARLEWLAVSERLEQDQERRRFELVAVDDRLRREAAQHLHGDVQSRLLMAWALLKHALDAATETAAAGHLERVQEQFEHLRGHGVRQARDLLGAAETDRPFSQRVTELVTRFQAVIAVELVMEPDVPAWEEYLPPALRRQAHLLLEEALINAFRHGQPSHIRVCLASLGALEGSMPAELRLTVEDDGVGFDPDRSSRGLGLSALSNELEQEGGRVALVSLPGHGTRLTVQLPLPLLVAERRA
ncbi:hypothetical protein J7643_01785 [bacterium]|nr:hypothetical protein [bacterium]